MVWPIHFAPLALIFLLLVFSSVLFPALLKIGFAPCFRQMIALYPFMVPTVVLNTDENLILKFAKVPCWIWCNLVQFSCTPGPLGISGRFICSLRILGRQPCFLHLKQISWRNWYLLAICLLFPQQLHNFVKLTLWTSVWSDMFVAGIGLPFLLL